MTKEKLKISEPKKNRGALSEGRNRGFGQCFVKKVGNLIEMPYPISACGDFINDQLHSQVTGKSWNIHGQNSQRHEGLFDEKNNCAYMLGSVLTINRGGKYDNYDRDLKCLESNYSHLEKFINFFEKSFKLKKKTSITRIKENLYLFKLPLFWTESIYLISLYKFLSRVGIFYDGGNPMDFLNSFDKDSGDVYMWSSIKPKIISMMKGFIPKFPMSAWDGCPHNLGIVSQIWPKEEMQKQSQRANISSKKITATERQIWKPI